ncbi:MAG: NAD(P)H-hydrate dehydratase [Pyrinomonadaceae bacterium]
MPKSDKAKEKIVRQWLRETAFARDSHKYRRGHALLIAGSDNYSGAAVLCGNAAMRSGVGLTTLFVPKSIKSEVASRSFPEVIVRALAQNSDRGSKRDAFTHIKEAYISADAIAVGCGLSTSDHEIEKLVNDVVDNRRVPVILDASALSFYSPPKAIPRCETGRPELILTPHEGEFRKLLGLGVRDIIENREDAVRNFAQTNNVVLVLKGNRVLIGEPNGRVVVNPTGNTGLGKAGNGDTLTGIIAGFVAQAVQIEIDIFETVVAAVYIAGLAGDVAEKKYGKRAMMASDVRECLAHVFTKLSG